MNNKKFKNLKDLELIIKSTKSSITFELSKDNDSKSDKFLFVFNEDVFKELIDYIIKSAYEIWPTFDPKEATSWSSDYDEYYDKKLDNNGYLRIIKNGFEIERPSVESLKLYQFNKRRLESFVYDIKNKKI